MENKDSAYWRDMQDPFAQKHGKEKLEESQRLLQARKYMNWIEKFNPNQNAIDAVRTNISDWIDQAIVENMESDQRFLKWVEACVQDYGTQTAPQEAKPITIDTLRNVVAQLNQSHDAAHLWGIGIANSPSVIAYNKAMNEAMRRGIGVVSTGLDVTATIQQYHQLYTSGELGGIAEKDIPAEVHRQMNERAKQTRLAIEEQVITRIFNEAAAKPAEDVMSMTRKFLR